MSLCVKSADWDIWDCSDTTNTFSLPERSNPTTVKMSFSPPAPYAGMSEVLGEQESFAQSANLASRKWPMSLAASESEKHTCLFSDFFF